MAKLVVACPSCSEELRVTRLTCPSCNTNLEGQFELPSLLLLPAEDILFISSFVRASGSLKAMAGTLGISYPTVRNRLDQIIAKLDEIEQGLQKKRHAILDALENGKLTVKEAEEALRKVGL